MMVVPLLKKVDETIAGIIISIVNGFEMPPVRYNNPVNCIKSQIKNMLALKSFIEIDFILNCKYKFVMKPANKIKYAYTIKNPNLR